MKEASKAMSDASSSVENSTLKISEAASGEKNDEKNNDKKKGALSIFSGNNKKEKNQESQASNKSSASNKDFSDLERMIQDDEKQILIKIDSTNGPALIRALMQYI